LLSVSGAGEPSAEEKENGSDCLYAGLPSPYATVSENWGAGGYRSILVLYLFIIKAM
jgi:hypothetical protein